MPEYVRDFFLQAAEMVGLKVEQRADTLWRVDYVPERFRATSLQAVKRFGPPQDRYPKLTFHKEHILEQAQHTDAELLSPGHPLFAAVAGVLDGKLAEARQGVAPFLDPTAPAPYRLHFFEVQVLGETPGPTGTPSRPYPLHAALVVVLENADGTLELAPPDILHDLTPVANQQMAGLQGPGIEDLQRLERWVKAQVQYGMVQERRAEREREVEIRREYLEKSFAASIKSQQKKWAELAARVAAGEETARLARDEALKRVDDLKARRQDKLAGLAHLRVLRPGPVSYLGTAIVMPAEDVRVAALMRRDDEVERIAMQEAMRHEQERGWEPEDVSALHDGSGFDIRSLGPADEYGRRPVRRIEVKGRAGMNEPVALTTNEWLQAHRHGDSYWLYVVWGCKTGKTRLLTIQDPASKLAREAQPLTVVKGYLLPAGDLERVQTQE